MADIRLQRISKVYHAKSGAARAVDDLTLAAADRELLVLVGPSGCGKTTILRLVAGLEEPSAGDILIGGRNVARVSPKDRDVAMVFQSYALYPHMTVYKNLAFGLKMRGAARGEIVQKIGEVSRLLGIGHLLDRKPESLSGGEQQRVAVGRAIVRRPQVFLFDEPLANLDAGLRVRMRSEFKTLQRDLMTTMIYVTHDQEEAMTLADRMAVLKDGRLQQYGTPLEIYHRPASRFVAGFVGTPMMNFLGGTLEGDGRACWFNGRVGRWRLAMPRAEGLNDHLGRAVVLGIRSDDVHVADRAAVAAAGGAGARGSGSACGTPGGPNDMGADPSTGEPPYPTLEMAVRLVEPLGFCTLVHVATATGEPLVARAGAEFACPPGGCVAVRVDLRRAHLFTADDDGRRIN